MQTDGLAYSIYLADSVNRTIGSFACSSARRGDKMWTVLILDDAGLVRGHVTYDGTFYDTLLASLRAIKSDVELDDSVAVLLPFCLAASVGCYTKALTIGNETFTSPVTVIPAACVHVAQTGTSGVRVDACLPRKADSKNGICWLSVNNVDNIDGAQVNAGDSRCTPLNRLWVGGCHLVLRAGLVSNLRVTTASPVVSIEGVLDG